MSIKVLFIGGTGIISSGCAPLAVERGVDLYFLNRGNSTRETPKGVTVLRGDIRDPQSVKAAIGDLKFDSVVDWVAFGTDHIKTDIELFRGRTKQFIFISSASAYQTPPSALPVTEGTTLSNPFWEYSRNKIACEEMLIDAYRKDGFPATIVRPSHTYDIRLLPFHGGWTVIDRMRKGKKVVVHGDGSSLWTMTHHKDFAKGFVPLLANPQAIGHAIHITSDEWLTWDQIHRIFADAAGCEAKLVHVPSDTIAAFDRGWGDSLLGDKTHSMIFDNTKIKTLVPGFACTIPLAQGARETVDWYDADPSRQVVDEKVNAQFDMLIELQEKMRPS